MDEADRKAVLDLTRAIEDLTEQKMSLVRQWDPSYGTVKTTSLSVKIEALRREIEELEKKKQRELEREKLEQELVEGIAEAGKKEKRDVRTPSEKDKEKRGYLMKKLGALLERLRNLGRKLGDSSSSN